MSDKRIAGAARGSYRSYLIGLALSVVLTVAAFLLVMTQALLATALIVTIVLLAVVQIGVHLVFFLHLNRSSEQRWNVVVFACTVVILAILVGASVWIMYHLGLNMMAR